MTKYRVARTARVVRAPVVVDPVALGRLDQAREVGVALVRVREDALLRDGKLRGPAALFPPSAPSVSVLDKVGTPTYEVLRPGLAWLSSEHGPELLDHLQEDLVRTLGARFSIRERTGKSRFTSMSRPHCMGMFGPNWANPVRSEISSRRGRTSSGQARWPWKK